MKEKTKPKYRLHDWPKLKEEYLTGDWVSVSSFFRDKLLSPALMGKAKGWADEKKKLGENSLVQATNKMIREDAQDLANVRLRQARLARFMQLKGAQALKKLDPENLEDARRLVVAGMDEERRALGMEGGNGGKQTLTQINIEQPKTNIDRLIEKLNYEGILELIAELKRIGPGGPTPEIIDGGANEVPARKTK